MFAFYKAMIESAINANKKSREVTLVKKRMQIYIAK